MKLYHLSYIHETFRFDITTARLLRDAEHPRRLPRLHEKSAEREVHKVDQRNKLFNWSMEQLHTHDREGGWLSKTTENSLQWIQQAVHEFECEDHHSACAHGVARTKKQRIDSNISGIAGQQAICLHVHDQREWEPIYRVVPGS